MGGASWESVTAASEDVKAAARESVGRQVCGGAAAVVAVDCCSCGCELFQKILVVDKTQRSEVTHSQ